MLQFTLKSRVVSCDGAHAVSQNVNNLAGSCCQSSRAKTGQNAETVQLFFLSAAHHYMYH